MTTPCKIWTGATSHGYGIRRRGKGTRLVHRQVMADIYGEAAIEGKVVRHTCDNPPCMNADHLRIGTQADNMDDAWQKGRRTAPRLPGEAHPRHRLTEADVIEIRRRGSESHSALGREFGVSHTAIRDIVLRRRWQHI